MADDGATTGTAGGPAGDGGTGDGQAAPGAPPPLISGDGGGALQAPAVIPKAATGSRGFRGSRKICRPRR